MPRSPARPSSPLLRIPSPFNRIISSARKDSTGTVSPKASFTKLREKSRIRDSYSNWISSNITAYTDEELQEYRQVFNMFDTDRSGAIGLEELEAAMRNLGLEQTRDELDKIIDEVDKRGNHEIDFDEFCGVMRRLYEKKSSWNEVIQQCFAVFDRSEAGIISKRDFQYVLREFGDITDNTIIEEIFNECDVDGNGLLDADEFADMVRNYMNDDDI
ncbi:hypothetical protein PMAYCL1PPCAC_31735 [Pristionchus mayeri]|uniref:EF-hand domain-containing protein n=1 Tax=Pristionchus mayeri TaxID=1317129 RepID=A0AAN5DG76_9BILA|nr:hypothetical protein PMAYCL1PPCAC_31735 [Pristionchus mayeri]